MKGEEFNANDRIGGFALTSIKRALTWVGISEERDDIDTVAEGLGCGRRQAVHVLEELEKHGFVTRTTKRDKWQCTSKGHQLVFQWQPPRRFLPAMTREDERVCGELFGGVACSILRVSGDGADLFEEARLEVGASVEYETDRLVEVLVQQPDDYDHPDDSSQEALAVYLSVDAARTLADGLAKAVIRVEKELTRRAAKAARQAERAAARAKRQKVEVVAANPKDARAIADQAGKTKRTAVLRSKVPPKGEAPAKPTPGVSIVAPTPTRAEERARDAEARRRRREALAATLSELKAKSRRAVQTTR
jgi:hypothetical protein